MIKGWSEVGVNCIKYISGILPVQILEFKSFSSGSLSKISWGPKGKFSQHWFNDSIYTLISSLKEVAQDFITEFTYTNNVSNYLPSEDKVKQNQSLLLDNG